MFLHQRHQQKLIIVRRRLKALVPRMKSESDALQDLVILIPAYNEEDRIRPTLKEFAEQFQPGSKYKSVVIAAVLNGCTDETAHIVEEMSNQYPQIELINIPEPIGKGGALIEGMKRFCDYDLICYVDADGATSAISLQRLISKCLGSADVVIGSRWLKGAILHQSQTWVRRFASRVFHFIVEVFFRLGIVDTQCPAKVARGEVIQRILPSLSVADLSFDVNFLVSAKKNGFKIQEFPTEWTDKDGSKVTKSLFRSSLVMFLSVTRLRLIYSPFYRMLSPLRPLEQWIYLKLGAPAPINHSTSRQTQNESNKSQN